MTLSSAPDPALPDVATLYRDSTTAPRNAAVLWVVAQLAADDAFDDITRFGNAPVTSGQWALFDELPRMTWRQNADWRRRMARTFDDLAGDIAAGMLGKMACPAEEMALSILIPRCEAAIVDDWAGLLAELAALPSRADDYQWVDVHESLTYDADIDFLFDAEWDGIEDPESEQNGFLRMGDYRPGNWFTPFRGHAPRDPDRGFRR